MPKRKEPHPIYDLRRYIKACGANEQALNIILDNYGATFDLAMGSPYKHQAWPGGYLQHVVDCIKIARFIYCYKSIWPVPFEWGSVVLVLFLHDLHKPFMQLQMAIGSPTDYKPWSKRLRTAFRNRMIAEYGIKLTEEEATALKYVVGEGADYHPRKRVMNELGAFCHAADTLSSRCWWDRNKPENTNT